MQYLEHIYANLVRSQNLEKLKIIFVILIYCILGDNNTKLIFILEKTNEISQNQVKFNELKYSLLHTFKAKRFEFIIHNKLEFPKLGGFNLKVDSPDMILF